MDDKLRVAVTGAGGEARLYMGSYAQSELADLVLVQDIDAGKAEEQAGRFDSRWTTDFNDLLGDGIDVVDVSTPNHLHEEQTISALRAGKHVICQKPMAPTVAACDRMIQTAEQTGRKLGMYMGSLASPLFHELREMIRLGAFGTISSLTWRGAHRGGYEAKDRTAWRGSVEKTGGGAFIQLAIHGVNLFQWLMGEDITEVSARSTNRLCQHSIGGDDLTHAVAEFSGGAYASFEAGYSAEGGIMALYGTKGSFVQVAGMTLLWLVDSWDGDVISYTAQPGKEMTQLDASEIGRRAAPLGAQYDQHEAFIRALVEGREPPVAGAVGRRDVAVCKAVYRSAEEAKSIRVDEM
jgi:predicted dehydrogenase